MVVLTSGPSYLGDGGKKILVQGQLGKFSMKPFLKNKN
jgi:hypothetical protein